jgi:hypothetical protein
LDTAEEDAFPEGQHKVANVELCTRPPVSHRCKNNVKGKLTESSQLAMFPATKTLLERQLAVPSMPRDSMMDGDCEGALANFQHDTLHHACIHEQDHN